MKKEYVSIYNSPVGKLILISNGQYLLRLCPLNLFSGEIPTTSDDVPPLHSARKWLDAYFSGQKPSTNTLPLSMDGTSFQKECWKLLLHIPYGNTTTYKEIAQKLSTKSLSGKMSCQAVGQAIRKNPIAIIVPCHRVIGSNGSLTGYAGGLDLKEKLLAHEKAI